MNASDSFQRTIAVVRGYADIVSLGKRRDLFRFQKTTGVSDVGLDDVSCLVLQEIEKAKPAVNMFSSSDPKRKTRHHLGHGFIVVRGNWFLTPCRIVGNHGADGFECHDWAEPSVEFEENVDILANRFSHGLHRETCLTQFGA